MPAAQMTGIKPLAARIRNASRYILRGDFDALRQRLLALRLDSTPPAPCASLGNRRHPAYTIYRASGSLTR